MITNAFLFGFQMKLGAMAAEFVSSLVILAPFILILAFCGMVCFCANGWKLARKRWEGKE